jgi:hypothetical protein
VSLPNGRQLVTLLDAGNYIASLPRKEAQGDGSSLNQLLTAPVYSAAGHSGRVCAGLRPVLKRACVPMALDPEEIVTLLLLAALAIAWNWRLGH